MALFITFEGIEGSGKSTQLSRLAGYLRDRGVSVLVTREPGGCPVADAVRRILLDPGNQALVPRAELLLYAAARAQHVAEVIRPALAAGQTVLCDRFTDATIAYQGYGRGLDRELIEELNRLATDGLTPDLTLLFDLPAERGLERARRRNTIHSLQHEDRFERESLVFHTRVRQAYLELAKGAERFRLIRAAAGEDEVAASVRVAVQGIFGLEGGA